jgi:decaprenylphospho-beta-D-ribofuranose 2-oxidase
MGSNAMELRERRADDLDACMEQLASCGPEDPYAVAWIDGLARGRHFGRGIVETAQVSTESVPYKRSFSISVPRAFPSWLLNSGTVGAFNAAYFHRIPKRGRVRRIQIGQFLFPLDAAQNWNRMYGSSGVFQFQCVVPSNAGRTAILELMDQIARSGGTPFLAVLKAMGREGEGMLSFAMPGLAIAVDFPRSIGNVRLLGALKTIALKHGGRIYLAKDASLEPDEARAMYPKLDRFRAVLREVDPARRMQSDMSRRLQLHQE